MHLALSKLILFIVLAGLISCKQQQEMIKFAGEYYYLVPPADTVYTFEPLEPLTEEEKNAEGIWASKYGALQLLIKDGQMYKCVKYFHHYSLVTGAETLFVNRIEYLNEKSGKWWIVQDSAGKLNLEQWSDWPAYYEIKDSILSLFTKKGEHLLDFKKIKFLKQPYFEDIAREHEEHRNHVISFRVFSPYKLYWENKKLFLKMLHFNGPIWTMPVKAIPHKNGIEIIPVDSAKTEEWAFERLVVDTSLTKVYLYYNYGEWEEELAIKDLEYSHPSNR